MENSGLERLADLMLSSKHTVALTGAGISTESGIPDFRTDKTGLYSQFTPNIFSGPLFEQDPTQFYDFARTWLNLLDTSQPNKAHTALAWLEKNNLLNCIITQNIDSLHISAGNQNVLEIHGHLREASCMNCQSETSLQEVKKQLYSTKNAIPKCEKCGGVLKPNVVFFGDNLPNTLNTAIEEAKKADLFLVLGSSLLVNPAAALPSLCKGNIAIINLTETPLDSSASVVIRDSLGDSLDQLVLQLAQTSLSPL